MRFYEPIWIKLKAEHKAKLAAPKELHRRIVKAVMKERTSDLAFRLHLSDEQKKCWIQYSSDGNLLKFELKFSIGLSDL